MLMLWRALANRPKTMFGGQAQRRTQHRRWLLWANLHRLMAVIAYRAATSSRVVVTMLTGLFWAGCGPTLKQASPSTVWPWCPSPKSKLSILGIPPVYAAQAV